MKSILNCILNKLNNDLISLFLKLNGNHSQIIQFLMGNNSRSPEDYDLVSKYKEDDWIRNYQEGELKIWKNKHSKQNVEVIQLHGIPSIEDMDIYTFRMMENDLIKVHHLLFNSDSDFCTTHSYSQILMQYIPVRLINLSNFDREQALTILSAALRAFHLLEIKFGSIIPSQDLIGFNQQGKAKIWLNRNSEINFIDKKEPTQAISSVYVKVKRIFEMIEQRTRYVLLPPIIKQEINNPYTTYLSALKALQKFAYYQKLNLRKYLRFGQQKPFKIQQSISQIKHQKTPSNLTSNNQTIKICCDKNTSSFYESEVKQPIQLRRNQSINSIQNNSNNTSIFTPIQQPKLRKYQEQQNLKRISILSNNSSHRQSPHTSIHFTHCNVVNISTSSKVQSKYLREGPANMNKTLQTDIQNISPKIQIVKQPEQVAQIEISQLIVNSGDNKTLVIQNQDLVIAQKDQNQQNIERRLSQSQKIEDQPLLNHQPFSIIDKIKLLGDSENQQLINQNEQRNASEPFSPTFLRILEPKIQLVSFGPSQENLEENLPQNDSQYMDIVLQQKISEKQRRRLSIENKGKLQFQPSLLTAPGSILNYCTSVESKLHMATNRQHSIIDKKNEQPFNISKHRDQQIQQYIRQKYKNISQNNYIPNNIQYQYSKNQNQKKINKIIKQKPNISQNKYQTSFKKFQGEDFLDVNYLEKSLDMRYSNHDRKLRQEQKKREMQQNDALNIAKLEQGLQKFSKSQLSIKREPQTLNNTEHGNFYGRPSVSNRLQNSTGFESHNIKRQKKINQIKDHNNIYQKQFYSIKQPQRFRKQFEQSEDKYKQRYEIEDNQNEYSFEDIKKSRAVESNMSKGNNRSYYIKQVQLSGSQFSQSQSLNKQKKLKYSQTLPFEIKTQKNKTLNTPNRRISYDELRKFLWN